MFILALSCYVLAACLQSAIWEVATQRSEWDKTVGRTRPSASRRRHGQSTGPGLLSGSGTMERTSERQSDRTSPDAKNLILILTRRTSSPASEKSQQKRWCCGDRYPEKPAPDEITPPYKSTVDCL
ncbi:hypothetical protein LSAT2_016043 [Lamellibrachia satsuma]|nr:hypothetical protein LSAT2_016043 [Lamellibrachia satsuma]